MPTPPERYADPTDPADPADPKGEGDDALNRLVGALDLTLRPQPAPPELRTALDRALSQRVAAASSAHNVSHMPGTLSRREALKAGAASMAFLLTLGHTGPELAAEFSRFAQEQARQGPMTGARLSGILRIERDRWNALLAQIGPDRMEDPGVEGVWSAKELVAHLTWYEQRVIEGARQALSTGTFTRSGTGLAALTMDERNARIAEESRSRPVSDVLAEAEQVFGQLVAAVAACPEDILNNPRILGLPDDVVPWMLVANNAYAHYREHEQSIRAWLDRTKRPDHPAPEHT